MKPDHVTRQQSLRHPLHLPYLIDNMLDGFAYCKMHYENDQPIDFTFIDVNPAFEKLTGLKNAVGKNVSEIIPGLQESNRELFLIFGRVSTIGTPEKFDTFVPELNIWLRISAYCPEFGYFVATFDNINHLKQTEIELRIAATAFETAQGIMITEANNVIPWVNQASANMSGYSAEEIIGQASFQSAIEGELHKAIENHQFQLYYQIQVDQAHRPIGAEALIRWIHPERGLVSPAEFLPVAEETGMILPIGKWVLETACAQLKAWQLDAQTSDLTLSVNVSAKQFRQTGFAAQVHAIFQRHAINPMRLKLELTESILLDDMENIIATMNAINALGVRFSLDDFGTGYSSLQYLKQLPLHQLKIDQSFVTGLSVDNNNKAIVNTIIAMAHSLNLEVIAEGVETEEQREYLGKAGCTHYQGYLIGMPMRIEQFEVQLKRILKKQPH